MRLQILGRGAAVPDGTRFGSAFVVELGERRILFDCGPATTFKMAKVGIAPTSTDHVFFTHHHFDHDIDYPCFLLSRRDQSIGREGQLEVFGPAPTELLTKRLIDEHDGAFAHDWIARSNHPMSLTAHERRGGTLPRRPPDVRPQDLRPGQDVQRADWSVQTVDVPHAQPWLDSLAYRLTTPDGSIVFNRRHRTVRRGRALRRRRGDPRPVLYPAPGGARRDTGRGIGDGHGRDGRHGAAGRCQRLVRVHQYPSFAQPRHRERGIAEVAERFGGEIVFGEELLALEL